MLRRSCADPLATVDAPRWLTISTVWGKVLESQELPPGTDLRATLAAKAAQLRAEGWEPEGDGQWAVFFARRGAERVEVLIRPTDPGVSLGGPGLVSTR